jgi:predicted Zn-dependent protease
MQLHQPGAATLAAEIKLHSREGDQSHALAALETLCASPDPDDWPVDAATEAFVRANWADRALKAFKRALKSGVCNPQVGSAAIRLLLARRSALAATSLFSRLPPGAIQRRAAPVTINGLANLKAELLLRWLIWRHREILAQDDDAWGQVGYALSNFRRMKQVVRWLADWRRRANVQPWMLFTLSGPPPPRPARGGDGRFSARPANLGTS